MRYHAISADSHVNEAPDLWETRLPASLRDRGPRLIDADNGGQAWIMEDLDEPLILGLNAAQHKAEKRYDRAHLRDKFAGYKDGWKRPVRYEDILPGSYDPAARLREQDEAKVQAEVLNNNPAVMAAVKAMRDRKLQLACFKAYNDWIAEYSAHDPNRLIGLGAIPVSGIDDATSELERCVTDLGLRSVALESYPNGSYFDPAPEDDRFWALAQELGVPVSVHATFTVPVRIALMSARSGGGAMAAHMSPEMVSDRNYLKAGSYQKILERLILSGLFDRFPAVQFLGGEVQCAWVPYYLQRFDDSYRRRWRALPVRLDLLPSEYFRRNAKVTFMVDPIGMKNRYLIGLDNLMWSTDFPHSNSNWPVDFELAGAQLDLADVPPAERERLMWRTCAELYRLPFDDVEAAA